ncbi:sensor histidine kinase [Actinoplanes couchii]|uniref:histidine kinase n=1 Tax=Actinoplanes couchii TaxID=403638 RepID=A0ABQ3XQW9_9ACTN|nr:histidine kinase [Actinoplanes couchii]MDR6318861.1 signal transduction histidine kinase [Actinoplanes couchii]GID60891.1 two-component sensor histidine kinase [Actinoplanes couchii]
MTGSLTARLAGLPPWVTTVALVALSLLDVLIQVGPDERWGLAVTLGGSLALVFRHRAPLLVVAATMPAAVLTWSVCAPLIAIFTLATRTRNRPLLGVVVVVYSVCNIIPWPGPRLSDITTASNFVLLLYNLALGLAPVALGQLVLARRELAARLTDITEAHEHEQLLISQSVLAQERAQIAREMHDVVSHQVSLIAVHAGALQVRSSDPEIKEAARTIRQLGVRTLDELRYMVGVLRASGGPATELTPQPTLDQLADLVAGSAVQARLDMSLPPELDLPPAVQRAVYRMVQEALTNVRKHAPGSAVTVEIGFVEGAVAAVVTNTAPTRTVVPLPGAGHGMVGLGQRAALLDGTLSQRTMPGGGFQLTMRLPVEPGR